MKRGCAAVLALCLAAAILVSPWSGAAPSVIFTAVNDVFTPNMTDETMPVRIGGQVYTPYSLLTRLLTVSTHYNTTLQRLMVYNFDHTLTFDLANSITYDDSGIVYSYNAVRRNGTIYIPISLVCQVFGYYYSYITASPLGPVVRVNTGDVTISDAVLVERGGDRMQQIYDAYVSSLAPEEEEPDDEPAAPDTPSAPDEPEETSTPGNVYLAFEGQLGPETDAILDTLSQWGVKAAFFISGEVTGDNADRLRRIFAEGHAVGLYAPGEYASMQDMLDALSAQNEAMRSVIRCGTRLLWMPGSSGLSQQQRDALINAGYRLWEDNLDPRAEVRTAYSVRVNVRTLLRGMERSAVVRLLNNEASAEALGGIISDLRSRDNTILTIREWDTPINGAREIR